MSSFFHHHLAKAAFIFLMVTFILFWPFFLKGEYIIPSDLLGDYYPWHSLSTGDHMVKNTLRSDVLDQILPSWKFFQEQIRQGVLPLWNPLSAQGIPFFTIIHFSFLSPLVLFFLLFFDLGLGFSLLVITKFFLLGFFMYLFLRTLKVDFWPAMIGSLVYMLCGFNTVWLLWPHTLVMVLAPLYFLSLEKFLLKPDLKQCLWVSLVVAGMLLAGFPAVAGYIFYAGGLFVLMRSYQLWKMQAGKKRLKKQFGYFILSFILGLLLSAIQLLPTLEYYQFIDLSYRSAQALLALPPSSLWQIIFPHYWGNPALHNWEGAVNFNETTGYIGIIALIFLLLGVVKGMQKKLLLPVFFGGVAILALSVVYNVGPLLDLIHFLPVFNTSSNTRLLSLFGFLGAIATALSIQMWPKLKRFPINILLFVFIFFDLALLSYNQNPTTSPKLFYPQTPGIIFLATHQKTYEKMVPFDYTFMIPGTNLYYGLGSVVAHNFYNERQRQLLETFIRPFVTPTAAIPAIQTTQFDSPLFDLFGVKYVVFAPGKAPADMNPEKFVTVYKGADLDIYENSDYMHGAFLVPKIQVEKNPGALLSKLADRNFNPYQVVYLEEGDEDVASSFSLVPLVSAEKSSKSNVTIVSYTPNRITYEVSSAHANFLLTTELFYPGWKAFIDGKEVTIQRANYIFRGVTVPAGDHEIKFIFAPLTFTIGAIISGIMLFFTVVYLLFYKKFTRVHT